MVIGNCDFLDDVMPKTCPWVISWIMIQTLNFKAKDIFSKFSSMTHSWEVKVIVKVKVTFKVIVKFKVEIQGHGQGHRQGHFQGQILKFSRTSDPAFHLDIGEQKSKFDIWFKSLN